ncbi:MAG TPA: chloride channel protein [Rariglobus sp.]|jgi:H+/Cl- antiporter ClcA|nr:chloride channel protein [Rariglobus sp.]
MSSVSTSASGPHGGEVESQRRRMPLICLLASGVGIAAAFAAYALYSLITLVSNAVFYQKWSLEHADATHHTLGLWVLVVPAAGGLIVGLMAKYGSPKIRGHGIPEAMEAVLFNRSRIAPRVALLKPLSVSVAIGTGGPFGAEGPIIQTGGALGSILGQLLHLTASERKSLLAAGAAAGMAATFSTPVAAVILAIELLLFEYKPRSFIPLVIASVLATATRLVIMGRAPMFTIGAVDFSIPGGLPWYAILGVLCGFLAVGFSRALYWIEDQFERLPFDEMWWPVLGGLGLGVIAYFVPRVLGVGYGTISDILNARLALGLLAVIMVAKALALLVSLGSGTSGGLLAPLFTVGAALGGLFAGVVNHLWPLAALSPNACALVAMAALFGAAARAPFTFIIFGFELTRDYNSILPLMLVVAVAHAVAVFFMRHSIMTEKLARRGLKVHQDYEVDVLHQVSVGQVMESNPVTVLGHTPIAELARLIAERDPEITRRQAMLVTDSEGLLLGILTRGDLVKAFQADPSGAISALEAATSRPQIAYEDEPLSEVLSRMLHHQCGRLPVVDRNNPRKIRGYLGRAAIIEARLHRLAEDQVREPGWLKTALRTKPR